jgi:lipopolysaccharide/colanic/teichoic acid biosynthesis glycosyltransferase
MKRAFDVVCSSLGLLVLSPLFLLISIAIRFDSAGPVYFRGERAGKGGRPFRIFKFRSMVADAAVSGPAITIRGDARVTGVGRFLRRTKMDELPQLINILLGDMSLVGPRPEDLKYVAGYTSEQREILAYRPGITSPASIAYQDESSMLMETDWENKYIGEIMPRKLAIDMEYFREATVWSDLGVILKTLGILIRKRIIQSC